MLGQGKADQPWSSSSTSTSSFELRLYNLRGGPLGSL